MSKESFTLWKTSKYLPAALIDTEPTFCLSGQHPHSVVIKSIPVTQLDQKGEKRHFLVGDCVKGSTSN